VLNPKSVSVKFKRDDNAPVIVRFENTKNWIKDIDREFRNQNFAFVPQQVEVKMEFYDSDYIPSTTWDVH
jgi:hypothetical protein